MNRTCGIAVICFILILTLILLEQAFAADEVEDGVLDFVDVLVQRHTCRVRVYIVLYPSRFCDSSADRLLTPARNPHYFRGSLTESSRKVR